jgi:hypothetical protein
MIGYVLVIQTCSFVHPIPHFLHPLLTCVLRCNSDSTERSVGACVRGYQNQWIHVVVVSKLVPGLRQTMLLYINGHYMAGFGYPLLESVLPWKANPTKWWGLGTTAEGGCGGCRGSMSHFAVFPRPLTKGEVTRLSVAAARLTPVSSPVAAAVSYSPVSYLSPYAPSGMYGGEGSSAVGMISFSSPPFSSSSSSSSPVSTPSLVHVASAPIHVSGGPPIVSAFSSPSMSSSLGVPGGVPMHHHQGGEGEGEGVRSPYASGGLPMAAISASSREGMPSVAAAVPILPV